LLGFLIAVYSDVLGRGPASTEQFGWLLRLALCTSRTTVASAILDSPESVADRVEADYELYLRRPADSGGLFGFVNALEQGAPEELVVGTIIGSEEYFDRS
jgi:hypothetical protein